MAMWSCMACTLVTHVSLIILVYTICALFLHAYRLQCWPITATSTVTPDNKYTDSNGNAQQQPLRCSNANTGNCQSNGSPSANQQQQQQEQFPARLRRTSTFSQLSSRWNTWRQAMDRRSTVIAVAAVTRNDNCCDDASQCTDGHDRGSSSASITPAPQQQQQLQQQIVRNDTTGTGRAGNSVDTTQPPSISEVSVSYCAYSHCVRSHCVCKLYYCMRNNRCQMFTQHKSHYHRRGCHIFTTSANTVSCH
jgi:hypothetical protein